MGIDIVSKWRMIARRQNEIERIFRIFLHLFPNRIKKDSIRYAPRRAFTLIRQFIGTMELIKAFAQCKMLDILPAPQSAIPEYGLIAHAFHHSANP